MGTCKHEYKMRAFVEPQVLRNHTNYKNHFGKPSRDSYELHYTPDSSCTNIRFVRRRTTRIVGSSQIAFTYKPMHALANKKKTRENCTDSSPNRLVFLRRQQGFLQVSTGQRCNITHTRTECVRGSQYSTQHYPPRRPSFQI